VTTIFMCHATSDKAEVEWIATKLKEMRPELEFWIDNWSMIAGDSLVAKISQGISAADKLVAFLTPASVVSRWVEKELDAGLIIEIARARGLGDNFVVPVVLKPLPPNYSLPALMAPRLRCDFTTASSVDAACADLLRGILGVQQGPIERRLENLIIQWEKFVPPNGTGFGLRVRFASRLTPEHISYAIDVGQPFARASYYFGSPVIGGAYSGVWDQREPATGVFRISIDQPRIPSDRPFVVEFIAVNPWTGEPVISRWTPY